MLAIAIVALPPILFPDLMVLALYSSHFVEAANTLYWFILAQAMMQVQGIATALMIGLDQLKAYAAVMVLGAGVNAALAVVLVPQLGLLGAGIAAFTSASILALGSFGYLRVRDGFRIGPTVGLCMLLLFIGLGLAGAFVGTRPSFEIESCLSNRLFASPYWHSSCPYRSVEMSDARSWPDLALHLATDDR